MSWYELKSIDAARLIVESYSVMSQAFAFYCGNYIRRRKDRGFPTSQNTQFRKLNLTRFLGAGSQEYTSHEHSFFF